MAARFHPDNPVSGDHEIFLRLCQAYEVLSRQDRRILYDHALRVREAEPNPIFEAREFVDGLDAELSRRFGILALLYQRRRTNQGSLGISLLDLESRMSLPREHLEFTLWYLRAKGLVQMQEENSGLRSDRNGSRLRRGELGQESAPARVADGRTGDRASCNSRGSDPPQPLRIAPGAPGAPGAPQWLSRHGWPVGKWAGSLPTPAATWVQRGSAG